MIKHQADSFIKGTKIMKLIEPGFEIKSLEDIAQVVANPRIDDNSIRDLSKSQIFYEKTKKIMETTNWRLIYQEQIVEILILFGAAPDQVQAYRLYKQIAQDKKAIKSEIVQAFNKAQNGLDQEESLKLLDQIYRSAPVAFSRSHAIGLAQMYYEMARLDEFIILIFSNKS